MEKPNPLTAGQQQFLYDLLKKSKAPGILPEELFHYSIPVEAMLAEVENEKDRRLALLKTHKFKYFFWKLRTGVKALIVELKKLASKH